MKIFDHQNYDEYVKAQIEKNEKKTNNVWVDSKEINLLIKKIHKYTPNAKFGICHGVRNAWEVSELKNRLGIDVIGTEISPSAANYDNTIQWDFHKVKDEWIDNVDFIYSNSFDHSYDPEMCIDKWMKCIKKDGVCFIHWMQSNINKLDAADCFSATRKEYRKLFNKKYTVMEEFFHYRHRIIFAIRHKQIEDEIQRGK